MTRKYKTYNPDSYMIFYKDVGLFNTEMKPYKEFMEQLRHQEKCGYDRDMFLICNYDYMKEVFFNADCTIEIDMKDVKRGVFKKHVLTTFKAEFFKNKLTELLEGIE